MNESAPDILHIAMPPEGWERPPGSNHELRLLRGVVGDLPVDALFRRARQGGAPAVTVAAYNVELYKALASGLRGAISETQP
ncbi:MAG: hypothetical protein U0520_02345 [Candidatus Saccharimonadales bacterium]